ncbi:unnamed protein product, partial [marine sediment metagenome]
MSQTRFSEFAVFFDDGGVMNDNRIRGLQYQKLVGEYFTPKFGGEPYLWAESNVNFIEEIMKKYSKAIYDGSDIDYKTYQADFVKRWIEEMFNYVGVKLPAKSEYNQIYREAIEYITPNIRSAYPGVVDSIKKLKRLGFNLYTASGEDSLEIKGYLQGMREEVQRRRAEIFADNAEIWKWKRAADSVKDFELFGKVSDITKEVFVTNGTEDKIHDQINYPQIAAELPNGRFIYMKTDESRRERLMGFVSLEFCRVGKNDGIPPSL